MATMKMKHINLNTSSKGASSGLKQCMEYIANPMKTENGLYVGAVNTIQNVNTAYNDMLLTKEQYGKETAVRQGYHFMISFKDTETDKDTAWNILSDFANEFCGTSFECFYTMHTNTDHLHGHFCFNSVRFDDGSPKPDLYGDSARMYHYHKQDWQLLIQPIVDKLCVKYGFDALEYVKDWTMVDDQTGEYLTQPVIGPDTAVDIEPSSAPETQQTFTDAYAAVKLQTPEESAAAYKAELERKKEFCSKNNILELTKNDFDALIAKVDNYDEFISGLRSKGYKVKYEASGLAVLHPMAATTRYRRCTNKIGYAYTEEGVKQRLAMKHQKYRITSYTSTPQIMSAKFEKRKKRTYKKRKPFKELMKWEQDEIRSMYRVGLITKKEKGRYSNRNNELIAQRKYELARKRMHLIMDNHISQCSDFRPVEETIQEKIQDAYARKYTNLNDAQALNQVFRMYDKLIELQSSYDLYSKYGDTNFKLAADKYLALKSELETASGHTLPEIMAMRTSLDAEKSAIRKEIYTLQSELRLCLKVHAEYCSREGVPYDGIKPVPTKKTKTPKDVIFEEAAPSFADSSGLTFARMKDRLVEKHRINNIDASLNRNVNRNYSRNTDYFIVDVNNPKTYLQVHSYNDTDSNGDYTYSTYKLFSNGVEVKNPNSSDGLYCDKHVDGWNYSKWFALKKDMCRELKLTNDKELTTFYREQDFKQYQEAYEKDHTRKHKMTL